MPGSAPNPTPIYRLVHIENLDACLLRGALYAPNHSPADGVVYRTIHRQDVQGSRRVHAVPKGPGGAVHDYVAFYFGPRSVMLYQLHTGRVEGYREGQEPLVHLVSTCQSVAAADLPFVFSDGHGLARFTAWYDRLADLDKVDWEATYATWWNDTPEDMDRQRRKQAEFLVHRSCPWGLVAEIGVYNEAARVRVENALTARWVGRCCARSGSDRVVLLTRGVPMIEGGQGNLLQADAEALVNTVNTVGHMGKGIALQFKLAYPENFKAYAQAVRRGEVQPGRMFVVSTGLLTHPRYIVNFPTKRHWRSRSRIEDIEAGLRGLIEEIERLGIRSIAIPPLGCGNGGLDWSDVRPRIVRALEKVPDVRVLLFEPRGAPAAADMPIRTRRPQMTTGRALLVKLMEQYLGLAYRLTLLEVQKLAYFLQEAGESLSLRYEPGHYGPYAANLNNVLERIEGHYVRGYGDSQKPDAEIGLLQGATQEADAFLVSHRGSRARLRRVAELIEGFETPYGMELLSSVHWVARHGAKVRSADDAIRAVQAWNERKRRMFSPSHIRVAWKQLDEAAWLTEGPSPTT